MRIGLLFSQVSIFFSILANDMTFSQSRKEINAPRRWRISSPGTEQGLENSISGFPSYVSIVAAYRKKMGHMNIPTSFIVPRDQNWPRNMWGFKLGALSQKVRQLRHSKALSTDLRSRLTELGFVWDTKQRNFEAVQEALNIYKSIYGDVLVPQKWCVPVNSDQFPERLWGLKLGIRVKAIRQAHQYHDLERSVILDKLGFEWNYRNGKKKKRFLRDFHALKAYKQENGDLEIPLDYVIPNTTNYSEEVWNQTLGRDYAKIRKGSKYNEPYFQNLLNMELGIDQQYPPSREENFGRVYRALSHYKNIHNHLLVPRKFKVAEGCGAWPEDLWGMPLGIRVGSIRQGKSYVDLSYASALDQIGFVWNVTEYKFNLLAEALLTYQKLNGNMYIPQKFVVDNDDYDWPSYFWGYKLGDKVQRLRQSFVKGKMCEQQKEKLNSIGFIWHARINDLYDWPLILRALKCYKTLYGDCDVPGHFEVPVEDLWPADMWSVPLGQLVQKIRHGKLSCSVHECNMLKELGFLFKDAKFELFMNDTVLALSSFKKCYGHCNVPNNFIIPMDFVLGEKNNVNDSFRWPRNLLGFPLGSRVKAVRQKKIILNDVYLRKFEELGFVFNVRKHNHQKLLRALSIFVGLKLMNGEKIPVGVSETYVVPMNCDRWPKELHGYRIGSRLKYLKKKMSAVEIDSTEGERLLIDKKWIQSEIIRAQNLILINEIRGIGIDFKI